MTTPSKCQSNDLRLLRDGEAYGFGTDGATGCFADAGAWSSLQSRYRRAVVNNDPDAGEYLDPATGHLLKTSDEETAADLVAFATDGDGTYPVWLGLGESGSVACVAVKVVDCGGVTRQGKALREWGRRGCPNCQRSVGFSAENSKWALDES